MIYNLSIELDRKRLSVYTESLIKEGATVELTRKKKIRSIQQNKYLHLALGWFAVEYGETLSYVKEELFKRLVNKDIFEYVRTNTKTGEQRTALKSSSDLTTAQMTTAIDRFRNYASREAGIYIPAPNEEEYLETIRIEMERNRQYI